MSENTLKYQSQSASLLPAFPLDDKALATLNAKLTLLKTRCEDGEFCDEIRSYHAPKSIVRGEYELLSYYKQQTFFNLAEVAYNDLCGILFLMEEVDMETEVSGETLQLIAGNISRSVELLRHICAHQADFTLLQVTTPE